MGRFDNLKSTRRPTESPVVPARMRATTTEIDIHFRRAAFSQPDGNPIAVIGVVRSGRRPVTPPLVSARSVRREVERRSIGAKAKQSKGGSTFNLNAGRAGSGREGTMEDADEDEFTCCHRLTFCPRRVREISVTDPIVERCGGWFAWTKLFDSTTNVALATMGWVLLYFLLGDTMLPGRDGFGFYAMAISASWLGSVLASIPYLNLPPVFGMLCAGLVVRNAGLYRAREELGAAVLPKIRTLCLTFVMIRAGLQLSVTSLREHPVFLTALAIVPSTVEILALATCCKYILHYDWDWACMAGTAIGSMSPVVTMSCVLALVERGHGNAKGLVTILCTAACIDDVHVLSLFSLFYSIVVHDRDQTKWWRYVPDGLRDAVIGILCGVFLGIFFVLFPRRSHRYATWCRMICLVLGSLMCTTTTAAVAISGGGFLASMVMSFVAMSGWRILSSSFDTTSFRGAAHFFWRIAQPILVATIGADIDLADLSTGRVFLHVLCIALGLTVRSVAVYLLTLRTTFALEERLFVVLAWLPKGTLQAALGPMAYEWMQDEGDGQPAHTEMALDMIRVCAITILLMAPIGASLIMMIGPILLEKTTADERRRERELSYLHLLSFLPTPRAQRPPAAVVDDDPL